MLPWPAGAYQSVYASPSFRGAPRYSRVAVVQGDGDDVWRGEVRLLFKAHPPAGGAEQESLALVKYFEYDKDGKTPMPPSQLTHTYAAGGRSGAGGSNAAGSSASAAPSPRRSRDGSRYTGAVRMRFAPESRPLRYRFAVMALRNIVRVEHVLTDFHQAGLDGSFAAFYVNPWKWSLENVGDDDARVGVLGMAPL